MTRPRVYESPTTPGLKINFSNYVCELIFLNRGKPLPPKFWQLPEWKKQYAFTIRGFFMFAKFHDHINDPEFQQIVIEAIKETKCASLLKRGHLEALERAISKRCDKQPVGS